eukprot:7704200-Pyramimonas_sp.AAC.1
MCARHASPSFGLKPPSTSAEAAWRWEWTARRASSCLSTWPRYRMARDSVRLWSWWLQVAFGTSSANCRSSRTTRA